MAAPRKGRREGYRFYRTLPGFGRVGPWQTGMRTKRDYDRVDAWLYEQALKRPEVVDGIIAGQFSLRDAWVAYSRGKLDELLRGATDPQLRAAADRYKQVARDSRVKQGLETIVGLAPKNARLSWLSGTNISELYLKALATRDEVSVYRSVHRAVRELLAFVLGPAGRDEAMRGVKAPKQQSRRKVRVQPDKLQQLVNGIGEDRFRLLVLAALLTAADEGPLLRLRVEDYADLPKPYIWIEQAKTRKREGAWPLSPSAARLFRQAIEGLDADARIFPFTKDQVSYRWKKARAGLLPKLQFRDLRHLLPSYLEAAGMPIEDIQRVLHHSNPETTLVYLQSQQAELDMDTMEKATRLMLEGVA